MGGGGGIGVPSVILALDKDLALGVQYLMYLSVQLETITLMLL